MDLKELNRVGRAAGEAADGLERIAGSVTGDRARRAWIGAFVLRAVSAWWSGDEGGSFLMRRAEQVVGSFRVGRSGRSCGGWWRGWSPGRRHRD